MSETNGHAQLKVLIVDDHELVREGLAEVLGRFSDVEVVAKVGSGPEGVVAYREHRPDVALVDLRMGTMDGVETILALRTEFPDARVILLTAWDTDEDIYRGLKAGAASYLMKDVGAGELVETIRAVGRGEKRIPAPVAAKLADHMATERLTPRQLDTLRLIVAGKSNLEIAHGLNITEGTVKAHVKAILAKLGARDRTQAATLALKRGLVGPT